MALGMLDWRDSIPIHHKQLGCKRSIGLQIMDFFLHPSAKKCKFNTYIAILPETPVSRIRVSSKLPIRVSCPVFESTCPTASLTDDGNPWDHDWLGEWLGYHLNPYYLAELFSSSPENSWNVGPFGDSPNPILWVSRVFLPAWVWRLGPPKRTCLMIFLGKGLSTPCFPTKPLSPVAPNKRQPLVLTCLCAPLTGFEAVLHTLLGQGISKTAYNRQMIQNFGTKWRPNWRFGKDIFPFRHGPVLGSTAESSCPVFPYCPVLLLRPWARYTPGVDQTILSHRFRA